MASLIKKRKKGHDYYYLAVSARINGKPRIVEQKYLGTLENIAEAVKLKNENKGPVKPHTGVHFAFADIAALLDISERLGIRNIIDKHTGKRRQGLNVSDSILLAAIQRVVAPTSKNTFYQWFEGTVLPNSFPKGNEQTLSSQIFWNNMKHLDKDKIFRIEDEIAAQISKQYNIDTNCLLLYNTNFSTYVGTNNPSELAQREHSKKKHTDLKIVGLSLAVSQQYNIPLFHDIYPGNVHDTKQFLDVICGLRNRCSDLRIPESETTLVFDNGNNSESSIEELIYDQCSNFDIIDSGVNFVGSLKHDQCEVLLQISKQDYIKLEDKTLGDTTVLRRTKDVHGRAMTVVIDNNPELYKLQLENISVNIDKCFSILNDLNVKLQKRIDGEIRDNRGFTMESITKKVKSILSAEYMNEIIKYEIEVVNGENIMLTYCLDDNSFSNLKEKILGKTILFTNQHAWSNEKIVKAYRSQYLVEEHLDSMKNTKHNTFTPIRHFTDDHIRVHVFSCMLGLTLASLLNLEFNSIGRSKSLGSMLDCFKAGEQILNTYSWDNENNMTLCYTPIEKQVKDYIDKFGLKKFSYSANSSWLVNYIKNIYKKYDLIK
ncbi:MAG: IS1634 family transposase [Deltaproteobacteria bacterium]|nr:IS1634 family transposase [Deltaproteobacteria bacterium]